MKLSSQSLFHVPVVGWLARDAIQGRPDAKYYFAFNAVAIFAGLTYGFGYAFVISVALLATGVALASLVILTSFDAFGRSPGKAAQTDPRELRKLRRTERARAA
jgi:hypothetical protein